MTAAKAEKARADKAKRTKAEGKGGDGAKGMEHRNGNQDDKMAEAKAKRDAVKAAKVDRDAKAPKKDK